MNDIQYQFVKKILSSSSHSAKEVGRAFAPSNIALCKYWGKRDEVLNLPFNSSISISLGNKGSFTEIKRSNKDTFFLNDKIIDNETAFSCRLSKFLDLFRSHCRAPGFEIRTTNNIPTSAGLASSASGFAALVLALNDLTGWELNKKELSLLARLGSGSASRSIYNGFVIWNAGKNYDGLDSYSQLINVKWPEIRVGIIKIDESEKKISSREAMKRCVATSKKYNSWPSIAEEHFRKIQNSIIDKDIDILGSTAEKNALKMHEVIRDTIPTIDFFTSETYECLKRIKRLRENNVTVYATVDAGPNIKILFLENELKEICKEFKEIEIINPFGEANA
jgi:diphosphomevalonate decarboxylase